MVNEEGQVCLPFSVVALKLPSIDCSLVYIEIHFEILNTYFSFDLDIPYRLWTFSGPQKEEVWYKQGTSSICSY